MSKYLDDPRFAHLITDPRFKNLSKSIEKVKIDKRFQSMFNDKKFKLKYEVDKYGRKANKTTTDDLKKYYELDSTDSEQEEEERRQEEIEISKESKVVHENDKLESDGLTLSKEVKDKLFNSEIDYARGDGRIFTDSSSDEDSSDDEEVFIEHVWGELDADAPTTDNLTKRLAVCNMDWDRIRASDILVLCSSFLPLGGSILSVKIYPSEYGKERLEQEDLNGPTELVEKKNNEDDLSSDSDDLLENKAEEGDDYNMEKLRQYQLNRLKYYYAVIECDSIKTADKLYKECDGLEYESTATKLDLRFIPDDTEFDDSDIKDVCSELPDMNKYKPRLFTTTALQQAKVELTWDETPLERREIISGKINEYTDADLRKYVAYSEEESEVDDTELNDSETDGKEKKMNEKDKISQYKSILDGINKKEKEEKEKKYEMEYTWGINVSSKKSGSEQKQLNKLTPIEKALEKKHEKNQKRKEQRKNRQAKHKELSDSDDELIPDGIDMNDPYFAEEFSNGNFEPVKKSSKQNKTQIISENCEEENAKELELLLDNEDRRNHFSLEKILQSENQTKSGKKRKHKLKKSKQEISAANQSKMEDDNFKIDINDDRFNALYDSHLFNIDPTDSHFKKTKGMDELIKEKINRRQNQEDSPGSKDEMQTKKRKKQIENKILIKSLKNKFRSK